MSSVSFRNEPYRDFQQPEARAAQQTALNRLRETELGREYPIWIAGQPEMGGSGKLPSHNPSRPAELIGLHQKASPEQADRAVAAAHAYFPQWAAVPAADRAARLFRAAEILRQRKDEFNAWLILESGKNWAEAEADTAEAIDFCNYYAHQMLRWDNPEPLVQMPGEHGVLRYLPLGVGVIIPPWNFPLAILVGMTVAALVTGNTVVIKPSSETPTIAARFLDVLREAGFPAESFQFLPGSGAEVGDRIVLHPLTRFISFTGSKEVGLRINELAARPQTGQRWIKRVVAEMGGKDAIIVDRDVHDLDAVAAGVIASAFGFQGQKCSACSRLIVDATLQDALTARLIPLAEALTQGPADEPAHFLGPVISARAEQSILAYIETGKVEGQLLTGGVKAPGAGYFLRPTIFAGIERHHRLFQEEIFGPVLAITRANSFTHALELANDSEYGLTGAVYSTNRDHLALARDHFFVGNLYLNRKCTGAMVGAHPFGGFNMSGTDSKAGGPDYLLQFLQAKTIAEKAV